MIYFKDEKTLKGIKKNMRAMPPFLRKGDNKTKKVFIDKGKSLPRVNTISVGRMMGSDLMIDLNSFIGMSDTEIVFKPGIFPGGWKDGKIFFVNEKDEEVAFFSVSEIKEMTRINRDI